jgi:hypothetical protein
MIFCNGFPKSGNHALMKAVELLGIPGSVNHCSVADGLPEGTTHHIFIKRDPRNVIVSWLRFHRDLVTPGKFLARFRRFANATLVEEMGEYEGWLRPGSIDEQWERSYRTYVVRYEDLISSDATMRQLAAVLRVPYIEGSWEQLENHTATWNAVKSDYRDVWTPDVVKAWYAEGGGELLTRWGY